MQLKKAIISLFILTINTIILGYKIDFEKIKISEDVLLQVSISFCVTEDNLFLVVDFKAGDVKIYNSNGKLETIIGRKGFGPNEFAQPLFCDYMNRKFIISDVGQRKIFIYERQSKLKFIRSQAIFSLDVGEDISIEDSRLYIAGNKRANDNITYEFYAVELEKDKYYLYYLPGYLKYGLNSEKEYKKLVFNKTDVGAIGGRAYFDLHDDFAYYLWEGNLKILKINLRTKDISTFGKKTSNYIQPSASKKLLNAFSNLSRQGASIRANERKKMSYVRQIFTSKKHVLVIYEARDSSHKDLGYMMQFYTLEGNFIKEIILPTKPGYAMCFDKKKNVLYSIKMKTNADLDESHYILKFKINENAD